MERRLLIAILLTFLVLTGYQWLVPSAPPPTAKPGSLPNAATNAAGTGAPAASTVAVPVRLPPVDTVLADTAERTIAIDNGVVHAVFSNRGGTLVSWELTQYHDNAGRPVDLVPHALEK